MPCDDELSVYRENRAIAEMSNFHRIEGPSQRQHQENFGKRGRTVGRSCDDHDEGTQGPETVSYRYRCRQAMSDFTLSRTKLR